MQQPIIPFLLVFYALLLKFRQMKVLLNAKLFIAGIFSLSTVKSLFKRTGLSYKWHLINEGKSDSEIS